MFDVGHKGETYRIAKAKAIIKVKPETISLIREGKTPKGDIFEAAKVSGILSFLAILPKLSVSKDSCS